MRGVNIRNRLQPSGSGPRHRHGGLALVALLACAPALAAAADQRCDNAVPGEKQLLWGDLHAHTAWSLDAYAFGTVATPADAFAFARGQPLRLANGDMLTIDRPLDFAAVTDHAETFDVMYLCTDPLYADHAYCRAMREARDERRGRHIFTEFLLPVVSQRETPAVCEDAGSDCPAGSRGQWRRVQASANAADEPCRFTALIGYEWSASPGGRHWHRNVIFRSSQVPDQAFDYVRYPTAASLWEALDASCIPADGCDVLAIPHNINWADGGGFDVAVEPPATQALRARFERLAEIHQEKGNSECLPADPHDTGDDCAFERLTANFARDHISGEDGRSAEERWRQTRSTYYRSLLTRGLIAYEASGRAANPLMLGAIGSTDNHFGTPGRVQEQGYWGSMSMLWQEDEARLNSTGYNPGGLVAVWAAQNTRSDVFDALKRREAYATSGPRISLRFGLVDDAGAGADACAGGAGEFTVTMGGTIARRDAPPRLQVIAGMDRTPLHKAEIVKVSVRDGEVSEAVHTLAEIADGSPSVCRVWQDPTFDADAPTYYYARIQEMPSPRWSRQLCERLDRCDEDPAADVSVQERAWSSPIWYEPGRGQ